MNRPRLLLDEDTPELLALTLRRRGYDAVHIAELDRRGSTDEAAFQFSTSEGRAILTHNVGDFLALVTRAAQDGQDHFGLILAEQVEFRDLLARTLRLLSQRDERSLKNAVVWLVR